MNTREKLELLRRNSKPSKAEYKCPKCKDTHLILVKDENGHEYAKDCECMAKSISERLMMASGISIDDINVSFKDFNTFDEAELKGAKTKAFEYYKNYRMQRFQKNNSLLLSGLPGRGKTMLGFIICNNLIKDGIPVLYVSYRDAITKLKQNIIDQEEYANEIKRLKGIELLYIDDLFKGKITESDINIMYELINYRYLKRKPIIVSTEKTPQELIDIDEALGSRIIEMCKGCVVTFIASGNYRLR